MAGPKTTLKEIKKQLRNPRDIYDMKRLLARRGKNLMLARIVVEDGHLRYRGTVGQVTSYWWRDINCVRSKSSLTRKDFRKRKCFEGSRKSAKRFALGNELASSIYAMVFVSRRTYPLFLFLKKRAILLIKEGKTVEEGENILTDYLQSFGLIRRADRQGAKKVRRAECEVRMEEPSKPVSLFNNNFLPVLRPAIATVPVEGVACEVIQDDS